MKVNIKKLQKEAIIPRYAALGDAGFDLHAIEEIEVLPGKRALIRTGLAFEIPLGYELQVRPRSGLALKKGISIVNSPGTVDAGYRGDVGIILINHGEEPFKVEKGDRIAQGVINKIEQAEFNVVEELSESERGEGGFGSTGRGK